MISGLQKRRNYSKELTIENRDYHHRNNGGSVVLNSYQSISMLKERSINKSLGMSESEQNLHKRRTNFNSFKPNQQLSSIESRFSAFSSKIKNMLKNEDGEEQKENNKGLKFQTHTLQKTRSAIFKRSQFNLRQFLEQNNSDPPYFIECLKRRNIISTETCMHIHNAIMTYKQYLRGTQLVKARPVDPKIPPEKQGRKTIVFDMDQTLIHTSDVMMKGYQLKVPFKSLQGKVISGYVNVRPHAKEIIKNMSKYFDVIVFTAGNQCYADPILDYVDPEKCIQHRLYRDSCTMVNNQLFVKDLRILGRKLQGVVLVDNAPHSYMMQLKNGIPILNYLKGKDDNQLIRLQSYLMSLLEVEDVRVVNNLTFRLQDYPKFDNYDKLIHELYGKWI